MYENLLQIVWTKDVDTGEFGTKESRLRLYNYYQNGEGIYRISYTGDVRLRKKLERTIEGNKLDVFFDKVWPGMFEFGFINPMKIKQNTNSIEN